MNRAKDCGAIQWNPACQYCWCVYTCTDCELHTVETAHCRDCTYCTVSKTYGYGQRRTTSLWFCLKPTDTQTPHTGRHLEKSGVWRSHHNLKMYEYMNSLCCCLHCTKMEIIGNHEKSFFGENCFKGPNLPPSTEFEDFMFILLSIDW